MLDAFDQEDEPDIAADGIDARPLLLVDGFTSDEESDEDEVAHSL